MSMALPYEHEILLYTHDYGKIKAVCTCNDFEMEFYEGQGIPLSTIERSSAIIQHREFHERQVPEPIRQIRAFQTHMERQYMFGFGHTEAKTPEGNVLTDEQVIMHRMAQVFLLRAAELRHEAEKQDSIFRRDGYEDPRAAWTTNLRNEMFYLSAILDPTMTTEQRQELRP